MLVEVREHASGIMKIVQCQDNLLEIVPALGSSGRFAGLLNRRKEQRDKNGDNRDDHQQFNQRESLTMKSPQVNGMV